MKIWILETVTHDGSRFYGAFLSEEDAEAAYQIFHARCQVKYPPDDNETEV